MKSNKDAGWLLILLLVAAIFIFLTMKSNLPLK
jgi:hypothetical protein